MKITLEYVLTGGDPVTVTAQPRAINTAERQMNFSFIEKAVAGMSFHMDELACIAWAQAVKDEQFLGPWGTFWDTLDDITIKASPDPTGPATAPSPD